MVRSLRNGASDASARLNMKQAHLGSEGLGIAQQGECQPRAREVILIGLPSVGCGPRLWFRRTHISEAGQNWRAFLHEGVMTTEGAL